MKNTLLGLAAATLLATPALAASWKDALFTKLDTNQNKLIERQELSAAGCKINLYNAADTDNDGALSYAEFFNGRELLGRCK